MEKAIAEAPNAHRGGRGRGGPAGGGGGGRSNSAPGPTARRRLIHSFRTFLGEEEEFFRTLLSRLATSLLPPDLAGLRALGVTISQAQPDDGQEREELSTEEKLARRAGAVPLAHKALICFGDLARYRELYSEPAAGTPNPVTGGGGRRDKGAKGTKGKPEGERKVKNWSRAAECYHQARLLLPDNGAPSPLLTARAVSLTTYRREPFESACCSSTVRQRSPLLDLPLLPRPLRSLAVPYRANQPGHHLRQSRFSLVQRRRRRTRRRRGSQVPRCIRRAARIVLHQGEVS